MKTDSKVIQTNPPPRFSDRAQALVGQEMFSVLERAQAIAAQGHDVYHLELGNPRLTPPPSVVKRLCEEIAKENFGYTQSAGHPELRQSVALRYSQKTNLRLTEKHVVISPANLIISQFLDLACNHADRVVFFGPAFPSYWAAAAHIGLEVANIQLRSEDGYQLTEGHVLRAISLSPRAIIINSGNNPTGAVYDRRVLDLLVDLCALHGIWLLSDETYAEVDFTGNYYSLANRLESHVVVLGSFSKVFSVPGFRSGYLLADPEVAEKFALSNSTLFSCLPIFTQLACASGLEVVDEYALDVRTRFLTATKLCTDMINGSGLLTCVPPQSGFYVFVNISGTGVDDRTFCSRLLNYHHTAVTPGRSFGEGYSGFIRIAACGDLPYLRTGMERVIACARELAESKELGQVRK